MNHVLSTTAGKLRKKFRANVHRCVLVPVTTARVNYIGKICSTNNTEKKSKGFTIHVHIKTAHELRFRWFSSCLLIPLSVRLQEIIFGVAKHAIKI